ncbi:MAG: pyrroline-5-carboxylate reductase dimerization domain-containing protein [Anaerovoracaceae bacterium]
MPNTPAQVGAGMTSISRNGNVSDGDLEAVKSVLDATGRVEETDESLINCVGSVSGSSPAYTFMYIQALSEAAVENGMTEEKARIFAAQSVLGAAKLALESDESLEQPEDKCMLSERDDDRGCRNASGQRLHGRRQGRIQGCPETFHRDD